MKLNQQIAVSLAVLGLAAGPAFAADPATPAGGAKAETQATFDVLDANKDGSISKDEAAGMKGLSESFEKLDANKDSKLDQGEFDKAMGK